MKLIWAVAGLLIVVGLLLVLMRVKQRPASVPERPRAAANAPGPLQLNCGTGLRPPVAEIIDYFQRRTGVQVRVNYGASNLLLGQLKLTGRGDLFLPGDDFYIKEAEREGLVHASYAVALFVPVIQVARGNPLRVKTIADLARGDVRLGVADERAAAIGRITPAIFATNGVPFATVRSNIVFTSITAPELGQAVALGHVDAAIVWRAVAWQYARETEIMEIPAEHNVLSHVAVAVLAGSKNKETALEFVKCLQGTVGREIFRKYHYDLLP